MDDDLKACRRLALRIIGQAITDAKIGQRDELSGEFIFSRGYDPDGQLVREARRWLQTPSETLKLWSTLVDIEMHGFIRGMRLRLEAVARHEAACDPRPRPTRRYLMRRWKADADSG